MKREILRFENVTRQEDGAVYLDNFSFYMSEGEIVGMLCVNDRGKSELLKLLRRNVPIESGRVYFDGRLVNSYLNSDYSANRVYVIDQQSSLIEDLSIADNIFVLRAGFKKYVINERILQEQAGRVLKALSMELDLNKRVSRLTTLERVTVEIVKAYLMGCRLLIFLYPDKLIGQAEYEKFHQLLCKIRTFGVASLYFCYHHWIMFQVCDRIALFSRGRVKKLFEKKDFTQEAIAPYILSFEDYRAFRYEKARERVLELKELASASIRRLNLEAGPGECITLLDSDNQIGDELLDIFTGIYTDYQGSVLCAGRELKKQRKSCLDGGMIVLDDNPVKSFLFEEMSYLENLCFLLDRKLGKRVLKQSYINSVRSEFFREAGALVDEKNIAALSLKEKYGLVFNKIRLFHPKILVINKPFAYGDMHCRNYILKRIKSLKESGTCIVLLTSYITDCLYLSDRIYVIKEGRNAVSLQPGEYEIIRRIF